MERPDVSSMAGSSMRSTHSRKLALFLPSLAGGGAERVMLNIANGFVERGIEVDLVLGQLTGPYTREVSKSVRIVELNRKHTISCIPGLTRYLRQKQPTVMLATLNHANIIALIAKQFAQAPTKLFVREANTITHLNTPDPRDSIIPQLIKWLYPKADGVIAGSEGVADDLEKNGHVPRSLIHTVYNPVITPDLYEQSKQPVKLPWPDHKNIPLVVAVGRLTEQKNFTMLIQAFSELLKERTARLLIMGEGEERTQLEKLIRKLKIEAHVALPGFVNNPFAYIAQADLFVLSSSWEGSPNALIQAVALGIPAVSTDCPFGPAEILNHGEYGRLSPIHDMQTLTANMFKSLESPLKVPPHAWEPYEQSKVTDTYFKLFF